MADELTPETMQRLRELHENATPPPWESIIVAGRALVRRGQAPNAWITDYQDVNSAELIAAVRNALPALLAAAEENVRAQEVAMGRSCADWPEVVRQICQERIDAQREVNRLRVINEKLKELNPKLVKHLEPIAARWDEVADKEVARLRAALVDISTELRSRAAWYEEDRSSWGWRDLAQLLREAAAYIEARGQEGTADG